MSTAMIATSFRVSPMVSFKGSSPPMLRVQELLRSH
jgi:hypothetical protein